LERIQLECKVFLSHLDNYPPVAANVKQIDLR